MLCVTAWCNVAWFSKNWAGTLSLLVNAYHVYRLAEVFCKMREHLRVYEGRHSKFVGLCGGGGNTGPARSRASGQVSRRSSLICAAASLRPLGEEVGAEHTLQITGSGELGWWCWEGGTGLTGVSWEGGGGGLAGVEEAFFTLMGVGLGMLLRDLGLRVFGSVVPARLELDVLLPFFFSEPPLSRSTKVGSSRSYLKDIWGRSPTKLSPASIKISK